MRASLLVCTGSLLGLVACGRTYLQSEPFSDGHGGASAVDAAGASGTDAVARAGGGAGGASAGQGGVLGSGGFTATGGRMGSGGASPEAGGRRSGGTSAVGGGRAGGSISASSGGAWASGGNTRTGGTVGLGGRAGNPAAGGRTGTGGAAVAGRIGTGGAAVAGRNGTGGAAAGGRTGTGGAALGGRNGTGGALVGTTGTTFVCGNGIIEPGEQCDRGTDNEDRPAFSTTQASTRFAVTPLVRTVSGSELYSYSSSSAHTGLEDVATSRIMLHLYPPALTLSLLFHHGVDMDSTGLEQPDADVQLLFSGLPPTTVVDVSDDRSELRMTSATTATGLWDFTNNTDGGALSGLPFPGDWQITIEPFFIMGISAWTWVQSDISLVNLDLSQPLTLEAYSTPSQCRTNCTIPLCGDGILDGGEICDPGLPTGYDCSSDCMSFLE